MIDCPRLLLFGQVKGRRPPGCPSSTFNVVAVRDCQPGCMNKSYKDAQNRLLWRGQELPRTYLAQHELNSVNIVIIFISAAQRSIA